MKKEKSRDRKKSGKDRRTRSRDRRRSRRGRSRSRRRRGRTSPGRDDRAESSHRHTSASPAGRTGACQNFPGCPRPRVSGTVCCCHLCFDRGQKAHQVLQRPVVGGVGFRGPTCPPGQRGRRRR